MFRNWFTLLPLMWSAIVPGIGAAPADPVASSPPGAFKLFARSNLVAWCIVPFDSKKRGPEERAAMLEKLGFQLFAYDYRAEHIPTFDAEIEALHRHGVRMLAWWFPGTLNDEARQILSALQRHQVRGVQLWVTGGGESPRNADEQKARIAAEARRLEPIAQAAAKMGGSVALYNHGGWFGEPENQVTIIGALRAGGVTNVGLVYNLHHGHEHLDRFPALLQLMKPHLLALNLNGMVRGGEQLGKKILPLGQGDLDLALLRQIRDSGWHGPIGMLNHTDEDAEVRLRDNLDGLEWLTAQLEGKPAGPKPMPRSWREPKTTSASPLPPAAGAPSLTPAFGRALDGGMVVEGSPELRQLPLTIECRARLNSAQNFNILVASEPKSSPTHWELYSYAGGGEFSVYQPGRGGEFKSGVNICDGRRHHLAAVLETNRVRLFVDGKLVKDSAAKPAVQMASTQAGGLAFGQLVERNLGCDGVVDEVRISRGTREISGAPAEPLKPDAQTIGLWNFDNLTSQAAPSPAVNSKYWEVEDATARTNLPLYKTIPAAKTQDMTPANGFPKRETFLNWHRSHGDNGGMRYSALEQINRATVTNLQVAWTYHSKDGKGNIQCNPIIVDGVMFAPTPGKYLVAIDAVTGVERWRFKPEGRPAFRGLIYWDGAVRTPRPTNTPGRILFCSGKFLYALDPKTGRPIEDFGERGRVLLPGRAQGDFGAATAAPAIFERTIVVPGFEKDVWGFDLITGQQRWTFHTVPEPGEFGHDTWDRTEHYSANCWGGMALDEVRGIAYLTTGSPKENFIGVDHRGQNLFANCVLALDVRTGQRLWHFQEIAHDIWDLDIPAPPNLATINRDGRRVDIVTAVTKIGNTLVLDRLTGKPVFPFRLRRAPASTLRGEETWPYQPDVELPEPFAKQEFTLNDITDRSDEATAFIEQRVKSATTGRFQPFSEGKLNLFFGLHGGAEWTGACIDPATSRLYVSANHIPWIISVFRDDDPRDDPKAPPTRGQIVFATNCATCHGLDRVGIGTAPPLRGLRHRLKDTNVVEQVRNGKNAMPAFATDQVSEADLQAVIDFLMWRDRPMPAQQSTPERPRYSYNGYPKFLDHEGYPGSKPPWGTLNCIDLNTGKLEWKVPLGEHEELLADGVKNTGTENFGGAIVTAGGLVFCSGTRDAKIRAFDAQTGKELWSAKLPWTGSGPPATYAVNGRQFVVISASGGGKLGTPTGDAYVAFALPK